VGYQGSDPHFALLLVKEQGEIKRLSVVIHL